MSLFADLVAAEVAALTPVTRSAPTALGYGTDISCLDDITDRADDVNDQGCLAQDVYHWLITSPGSLPGDSAEERSWGLGLPSMLHRGLTPNATATLGARIQQGLGEDDRIASVTADVGFANGQLDVRLQITPADSNRAFDLIVYVAADGSTNLELV